LASSASTRLNAPKHRCRQFAAQEWRTSCSDKLRFEFVLPTEALHGTTGVFRECSGCLGPVTQSEVLSMFFDEPQSVEILCDAPPYSIVRACRKLSFHSPEDVAGVTWVTSRRRRRSGPPASRRGSSCSASASRRRTGVIAAVCCRSRSGIPSRHGRGVQCTISSASARSAARSTGRRRGRRDIP